MRRFIIILLSLSASVVFASSNHQSVPQGLPAVLSTVMPAVVNIVVDNGHPPAMPRSHGHEHGNRQPPPSAHEQIYHLGSGVIVNEKKGYLLTNFHLIKGAKAVTVNLSDGRKFKAKIVGGDALTDLAVLHIQATNLHALKFADSDKAKVGDFVAAIGNPFGLSQTVTSGIISAVERTGLDLEGPRSYENFIQTDASINPGNSGGALVNAKGELVGINTAILAPSGGNVGIGFAIPINMASLVMQQLIEHGQMARGMIGVMVQNITPELSRALHRPQSTQGTLVTHVTAGSPAANAGIVPWDLITHIDGKPMRGAFMVRNAVGLVRAGSPLKVQLQRGDKAITVVLNTAEPSAFEQWLRQREGYLFGVSLTPFSQIQAGQGLVKGVLVVHVVENSAAWHAGLMPGDVIIGADHQPITSLGALKDMAEKVKSTPYWVLHVLRQDHGALFVPLNRREWAS